MNHKLQIRQKILPVSAGISLAILIVVLVISQSGCGLFEKTPSGSENTSSSRSAENGSAAAPLTETENDWTADVSTAAGQEATPAAETTGTEATFVDDNSWVYVNTAWLNIRQGPSTEAEILTKVYYGQAMQRTATGTDWSAVLLDSGLAGYAYNNYLSLDPLPSPTPTWPAPTPIPSGTTPTTTGR